MPLPGTPVRTGVKLTWNSGAFVALVVVTTTSEPREPVPLQEGPAQYLYGHDLSACGTCLLTTPTNWINNSLRVGGQA